METAHNGLNIGRLTGHHQPVKVEAGHTAQNVYLQAVSLNLGTVVVGAFDDAKVKTLLNMPDDEEVLYVIPIGKK